MRQHALLCLSLERTNDKEACMSRAIPSQMGHARDLLAREGTMASADECATAAGRVHDKLVAHLAPLLGPVGVRALLARSATLVSKDFSFFLDLSMSADSTNLQICIRAQDPADAADSAAALFGTFLTLITAFIGERLTAQVLQRAWPTVAETDPKEKT